MNYLLYNTKQRKFLKEINRGLTKKVSDAHHWSSCELEEFEIAREMSTGKTRVITIPQALTDLQEEDLLHEPEDGDVRYEDSDLDLIA